MPAELMLCGFFVLGILNGIANSIKNGCQNKKNTRKSRDAAGKDG